MEYKINFWLKITRSVVLLSSPRATLGQRKSLINSIAQISKPPVQWPNNTTTLPWQTKSTQQRGVALRPNGPSGGSPSGLLPRTLLFRRTRMPVGRTSSSTRRDERLERPADVPSRFPVSSRRTDAPLLRSPQTLQLLPTTATSTYPGSRSRPAGRRSILRSPDNSVDDPDVAHGTAVPS